MERENFGRGRELLHPLPLAAVLVLVVNDHLLKGNGLLPEAITGKLSDVAGLFFFPCLLVVASRALVRRASPTVAVVLTGLVFAAVKTCPAVNAIVAQTWGEMVMDPTDLLTLPVLGLSWLWMRRPVLELPPTSSIWSRAKLGVAVTFAGLASMATSQVPRPQAPRQPLERVGTPCATLSAVSCEIVGERGAVLHVAIADNAHGQCNVAIVEALETSGTSGDVATETRVQPLPPPVVVDKEKPAKVELPLTRPYPIQGDPVLMVVRVRTQQPSFRGVDELRFSCVRAPAPPVMERAQ